MNSGVSGLMAYKNPDDERDYRKRYAFVNKDKLRLKRREYHIRNLEYDRHMASLRDQTRRLRVLLILGDKCVRCGYADRRALQIDHIDGTGHKERRAGGGKYSGDLYRRVLSGNTKNLQILCANCNYIKRRENGEWGSQKRKLSKAIIT